MKGSVNKGGNNNSAKMNDRDDLPSTWQLMAAARAFGPDHAYTNCLWDILSARQDKTVKKQKLRDLWGVLGGTALERVHFYYEIVCDEECFRYWCEELEEFRDESEVGDGRR